jgi:hypothetical protein
MEYGHQTFNISFFGFSTDIQSVYLTPWTRYKQYSMSFIIGSAYEENSWHLSPDFCV